MKRYADQSGDSGVSGYEIGAKWILVRFRTGGTYRYDFQLPGRGHVEEMKSLAKAGAGLATYINQHVRENYAEKLDD